MIKGTAVTPPSRSPRELRAVSEQARRLVRLDRGRLRWRPAPRALARLPAG